MSVIFTLCGFKSMHKFLQFSTVIARKTNVTVSDVRVQLCAVPCKRINYDQGSQKDIHIPQVLSYTHTHTCKHTRIHTHTHVHTHREKHSYTYIEKKCTATHMQKHSYTYIHR